MHASQNMRMCEKILDFHQHSGTLRIMPNPTQLDLREYPLGVSLGEFRTFAGTLPESTLVRIPSGPVRNLSVRPLVWAASGTPFLAITTRGDEDQGLELGQILLLTKAYPNSAQFYLTADQRQFIRQLRVVSEDNQPSVILET